MRIRTKKGILYHLLEKAITDNFTYEFYKYKKHNSQKIC
jgi:hypothetical protein